MKIRLNKKYLPIALLSLALFSSCDYLDVVPPATATIEDGMRSKDDAIRFVFSCYAGITDSYTDMFSKYESSADEFTSDPKWDNGHFYLEADRLSAATQTWPWGRDYDYLGRCFLFEKEINSLDPVGVTEEDRSRWKGEMLFLRAFYHFQALEFYGPIPLMTKYESMNTLPADMCGRYHFDYCVDSIASWLDQAAKLLPAKLPNEEIGRATSTACKALKGRLLLYAASPLWNGSFPYKDWKNTNFETPGYGKELVSHTYDRNKWTKALNANLEALSLALGAGGRKLFDMATTEILQSNDGVPLPNIPGVGNDEEGIAFKKRVLMLRYAVNSTESRGNKESIFKAIYNNSDFYAWGGDTYKELPTKILKDNSGGWYSGLVTKCPYLYTMEHFYTKNGKLPDEDTSFPDKEGRLESAGLSTNKNIIKLNVNREPRYYAWLSFDGDEYSPMLNNGKPLVVDELNSNKQGYAEDNGYNGQTGFFSKKEVEPDLRVYTNRGWSHDMNYSPIIRLPELYLNIAECYEELGDNTNAMKYLNVVRERAGIPDLTSDDITSDMTMRAWVHSERFIELWGEYHRYFDLRRWMEAPDKLNVGSRECLDFVGRKNPSFDQLNKRVKCTNVQYSWSNRMYLFPINNQEIYSNPQLVQAPGGY